MINTALQRVGWGAVDPSGQSIELSLSPRWPRCYSTAYILYLSLVVAFKSVNFALGTNKVPYVGVVAGAFKSSLDRVQLVIPSNLK